MKTLRKIKKRRARCKRVLVVLNNKLETVDLIREEIHPQTGGDYEVGPLEMAVMRVKDIPVEVYVPLQCAVFLLEGDMRRRV